MAIVYEPTEKELVAQLESREKRLLNFLALDAPDVIIEKEREMIKESKKRLADFRKK